MGNAMSQEWNHIHDSRDWGKYPSEEVIRFVARNFYGKERDQIRILDFGCGQGANTWFLAREGFDTFAFDGAPAAVEKAKKMIANESLHAQIDVMDGIKTSYNGDFFDAVIDSFCTGHNKIDDIRCIYREIFRILKSGGRLFSSFFDVNTTGFGTGEMIEKNTFRNVESGPLEGLGIVHFWEKEELSGIVAECGFSDITIENYMHTDRDSVVDSYVLTAVKH